MRQKNPTKILTKAESRELSPQLSVHQEDSPSESTLASLITEAAQEVQQKRKGSEHQLQEVHFFLSLFFFFFFFAASAPQSLDPEGREGGEEDGRRMGGSPAERRSVREEEKRRKKGRGRLGRSDGSDSCLCAASCVSFTERL